MSPVWNASLRFDITTSSSLPVTFTRRDVSLTFFACLSRLWTWSLLQTSFTSFRRVSSSRPLLNCRVQSAELDPGIGGREPPPHLRTPPVPLLLPRRHLPLQLPSGLDPPVQALPG